MANNQLQGKVIGVKLNDVYYKCQTDATLNLVANLTEDETCKPDPDAGVDEQISWLTRTVTSKDWNVSFSAKSFINDLVANNNAIIDFFIDSNLEVELDFQTNPGNHLFPYDFIFTGDGLMSSLTLNAPEDGASTYDVEVQGNGKPTYTTIPVTT